MNRKIVKSNARPRTGKAPVPVQMSLSDSYAAIVRFVQASETFDRIQMGIALGVPFGTISKALSAMEYEGYIERTGEKAVYSKAEMNSAIRSNPDLHGHRGNYAEGSSSNYTSSILMKKSVDWSKFMARWKKLLAS